MIQCCLMIIILDEPLMLFYLLIKVFIFNRVWKDGNIQHH
jgi:hypothetical protein